MSDFGGKFISGVVSAVREAVGRDRASLHEPSFEGNELKYVADCIQTGWVSSVGSYVDRFESMIREITGAAGAAAVVNGTCGLHACLVLAGVEPGDEVVIPALTFVGTANAAAMAGAVPHFVDSESQTLGLDPAALRARLDEFAEMRGGECFNRQTGRRIKAAVPVHIYGHPANAGEITNVCGEFGIEMIEDAAEALGSLTGGRHVGLDGRLSVLSFNGNKTVTTGGGGAIYTRDRELAAKAKHLTSTAKKGHPYKFLHDMAGFNYRMPNLNAALGCAQLEMLPEFLARKRALAARYEKAFAGIEGVCCVREPGGAKSNYWLNSIILDEEHSGLRDQVVEALNEAGMQARPAWNLLSGLPMYEDCPRDGLETARRLEAGLINLPSGPGLSGA